MIKKRLQHISVWILGAAIVTGGSFGGIIIGSLAQAQTPATTYQPKFPGDPARSESEAQALAYMRVVLRAEYIYNKRHDKYADSLASLAGTGSFTRRMAKSTERGD